MKELKKELSEVKRQLDRQYSKMVFTLHDIKEEDIREFIGLSMDVTRLIDSVRKNKTKRIRKKNLK